MSGFANVRFHGQFRSYQQRVLDHADQYIADGKIHIVAAPGSGKTVLGLELIRRLGKSCIILSPTTAIRQQWGERFRDLFLDDPAEFENLFSNDLHTPKTVNSITYQALYTAIEKIAEDEEEDANCSDIDLFCTMKANGIRTICLDEAHHLKNEWQKALEKFIAALPRGVKLISLTATPPYDAEGGEWNRYIEMCGEIDEEIFVPELVGQHTLCPHQDYVYFNYPTREECEALGVHKQNAAEALEEIRKLAFLQELCQRLGRERDYEQLFSSVKEYVALLVLFRHFGYEVDAKLIRELTTKRGLPTFSMKYAEVALQFLCDGELLTGKQKDELVGILKWNSVYDKRRVSLVLNEKLRRSLISSVGKLESIRAIASHEYATMGEDLRLLVLTDYIKKENLSRAATAEKFESVNVVSIFESLRRELKQAKIGVLSGTLVILPACIDLSGIKHKKDAIEGTDYCVVTFMGANHRAVDFVGKLFEVGELQILVGTKSLLGEGWDSPCINSLILASFVGSFVLSNQMRGRAIRIDKRNPDKVSNIWHLVTVEPEHLIKEKALDRAVEYLTKDPETLHSYDFEILVRRFDSFMGPRYSTGVIESGIERITAIAPPFDEAGVERINKTMKSLSARRADVAEQWGGEVSNTKFAVAVETEIPQEARVPVFSFYNAALVGVLATVEVLLLQAVLRCIGGNSFIGVLLSLLAGGVVGWALYRVLATVIMHINPARSIQTLGMAVYRTLCACELISPSARIVCHEERDLSFVALHLRNASIHDQNVFNTAMAEMLSPIENPRYILISKNIFKQYNYNLSFACPSVIGKKKEYVAILAQKLKAFTGTFEPVYTHKEDGRRLILKCRRHSYVTKNRRAAGQRYRVSHTE